MIKLKSLLLEKDVRANGIPWDTFVEFIKGDFKNSYVYLTDNFGNNVPIRAYGSPLNKWFNIIHPISRVRKSMQSTSYAMLSGTNNFHTALIDLLPSWKNWPKRSLSVIFSNSLSDASRYGDFLYYVLPTNDAEIAVCPKRDFWESFPVMRRTNGMDIAEMNSAMEKMFLYLKKWKKTNIQYNWDTLTPKQILTMFEEIKKIDMKSIRDAALEAYIPFGESLEKFDGDFLKYFDKILNPYENGFDLVKTNDIFQLSGIHEMFTEDVCLLIDQRIVGKEHKNGVGKLTFTNINDTYKR